MNEQQPTGALAKPVAKKHRKRKPSDGEQTQSPTTLSSDVRPIFAPKDELMLRQLIGAVPIPAGTEEPTALQLHKAALDLYEEVAPKDALESMLVQQLVAVHVAAMAAFARSARAGQPPEVRAIDLNLAVKATKSFAAMMAILDQRRGIAAPKVMVGQVKVESGGQAVVGVVEGGGQQAGGGSEHV